MKEERDILCGIYKIENLIDGKFYIGSSKNIYKRWDEHECQLEGDKHPNNHLQRAWNKYGSKNFKFSIIELCEPHVRIEREQYYIKSTNCCDHKIGYNIMSSATMKEIPKEVRLKISQTLVGEYCGEKSPNSIYNEEQIKNVIKDLLNPHLKLNEIATKNSVEMRTVTNVYIKKSWKHLTKDIEFPKRDTISDSTKLTKKDIPEIINMMLDGKNDGDIANIYQVNRKTISDIRHHKTWIKFTEDIVLPSSDGLRRGDKNNKSKLKEEEVIEIKIGLLNNVSMANLSKKFNVSIPAIKNIKNGKAYSYVNIKND